MKTFKFVRTIVSDSPGWECDFYKSEDINGVWMTERGCMVAILSELGYEVDVLDYLDEYSLDQLLLENNIYCQFVED